MIIFPNAKVSFTKRALRHLRKHVANRKTFWGDEISGIYTKVSLGLTSDKGKPNDWKISLQTDQLKRDSAPSLYVRWRITETSHFTMLGKIKH